LLKGRARTQLGFEGMVDYSKWDHIGETSDDESDDDAPEAVKEAKGMAKSQGFDERRFSVLMGMKQKADLIFDQGEAAIEEDKRAILFNKAILSYKDILHRSGSSPELSAKIHFSLAVSYSRLYAFKLVVENATKSLDLEGRNPQALQLRGMAHLNLLDSAQARMDWERASLVGCHDSQFVMEMNKLMEQLPKQEEEEGSEEEAEEINISTATSAAPKAVKKPKIATTAQRVTKQEKNATYWFHVVIGFMQGFLAFLPEGISDAMRSKTFLWLIVAVVLGFIFGPQAWVMEALGMAVENVTLPAATDNV